MKCLLFGHKFVEVSRTFNPPKNRLNRVHGHATIVQELFNADKMGVTNIECKCVRCGVIELTQCTGKVIPPRQVTVTVADTETQQLCDEVSRMISEGKVA